MKHIIASAGTGAFALPPPTAPSQRPPAVARWRARAGLAAALAAALLLAACGDEQKMAEDPEAKVPEGMRLNKEKFPSPAGVHCREAGGTTVIATRGDGGEYGICVFESGGQCDDWAMMVGFCPVGGIDVSVYPTPAARYCALRGGGYKEGESGGPAECRLVDGTTCPADAYFNGACGAG